MKNLIKLFEKEIQRLLSESPVKEDIMHSKLVLKWVLKLKPDCDDALKIAAIAHDIDRAITKITEKDLKDYSKIKEFKNEHALRSANFTEQILKKYDFPRDIKDKALSLIRLHECGGDNEADILMNADSLAYLEYNISPYLERNGLERTKQKITFMFERMSDNAKQLIKEIKFSNEDTLKLIKELIKD